MTEYKKEVKAWLIIRTQSAQWNQVDTSDVICMLQAKLTGHARDKMGQACVKYKRKANERA